MPSTLDVTLSEEQVEFFRDHGYLAIDRITTDEEIEWMRGIYDEVIGQPGLGSLHFEGMRDDGSVGVIEQLIGPEFRRPELLQGDWFRTARRLACTLLGVEEDQLESAGTHMIYKPAGLGRDTPWHQDEAYWDWPDRLAHSLSVWTPLDVATVESGCMQYLPDSHKSDVLAYRNPPGPEPLVLDEAIDLSDSVACPIPAGGATFHHARTVHYAGPNTTDRPRRAISGVFHGPTTPRTVPFERPWLPL